MVKKILAFMGSVIYLRDVELFFVFLGFVLIIYAGIQSLLILLKVTKYLNIFFLTTQDLCIF